MKNRHIRQYSKMDSESWHNRAFDRKSLALWGNQKWGCTKSTRLYWL